MNRHPVRLILTVLAGCLAVAGTTAGAQTRAQRGAEDPNHPCGMIYTDHYGPLDFRTQKPGLKVVEDFHFTTKVETLMAAQSGYIGGDLNYTLRASPNHARALIALTRWIEKSKTDQTRGMDFPAECYFDRAIRFAPDDTVVRALFARFLHQRKRTEEGLKQLDTAVTLAKDNAISHYNIGMVYLELGAPDKALIQAHSALRMGLPRTQLADQLKAQGRWQEPQPAPPEAPASAPQ